MSEIGRTLMWHIDRDYGDGLPHTEYQRARITAAMVEAAARAIWMRDAGEFHGSLPWEELRDEQRIKDYRSKARAALAAAFEGNDR